MNETFDFFLNLTADKLAQLLFDAGIHNPKEITAPFHTSNDIHKLIAPNLPEIDGKRLNTWARYYPDSRATCIEVNLYYPDCNPIFPSSTINNPGCSFGLSFIYTVSGQAKTRPLKVVLSNVKIKHLYNYVTSFPDKRPDYNNLEKYEIDFGKEIWHDPIFSDVIKFDDWGERIMYVSDELTPAIVVQKLAQMYPEPYRIGFDNIVKWSNDGTFAKIHKELTGTEDSNIFCGVYLTGVHDLAYKEWQLPSAEDLMICAMYVMSKYIDIWRHNDMTYGELLTAAKVEYLSKDSDSALWSAFYRKVQQEYKDKLEALRASLVQKHHLHDDFRFNEFAVNSDGLINGKVPEEYVEYVSKHLK